MVWCCFHSHGVVNVCLVMVKPLWVVGWSALLPLGYRVTEALRLAWPGLRQVLVSGGADGGNGIGGCQVVCHVLVDWCGG